MAFSFIFKDSSLTASSLSLSSAFVTTSPFLTPLLSPSYKDPCDYIGPTQIIQDNLPSQDPSLNLTHKVPSAT